MAPRLGDITSLFVHTDLPPAGSAVFGGGPASSVLNQVLAATRASQLSNWNDIHTDCPTREKHGWLGDTQISAETDLYTFDTFASHAKFLGAPLPSSQSLPIPLRPAPLLGVDGTLPRAFPSCFI